MAPFHLQYTLSRRQRLAVELYPWLPALAGTIGFVIGALYLSTTVSRWFLIMLALPAIAYRGLFTFLFDVAVHVKQSVDLLVEDERFCIQIDGTRCWLALDGIIQVFRSENGSTWTVLHLDGTVLTIPADAITSDQLDFLKSFALRAARERRMSESEH